MSMKRLAAVLLAAVMTVMLAVPAFAATEQKEYKFTYNKVQYTVGMDAKTAFDNLGTAKSSRDVNNCANGYINKAYTYGDTKDFEVYIEQDKAGKEIVVTITLMTDKVATEEGLKVGDSEETILSVYKDAKKSLGCYKVNEETMQLYIKVQNGKVSFISYNLL